MNRVLHVVISLAHGGAERLVCDMTVARNRRRPGSTAVCCLDETGDLAHRLGPGELHCLSARRARFPLDVRAVWNLHRLIKEQAISVVHSHNLASQQYAGLAAPGTGAVHVHTEHGSNPHVAGPVNRIRNAILRRLTRRMVAVSDSTAAEWAARQRVPRQCIAVIPNGIALDPRPAAAGEGRARARSLLGLAPELTVVGSVGRLAWVKGYDRLMAAFANLRAPGGSAGELVLVGDGPERDSLERMARRLCIAPAVRFVGQRDEARELIAAFDLFVLPSRSEGLPLALLEAMAAGVPVAVTDAGESRRVVDDGRCGWLLPPDEDRWPDALAQALAVPAGERAARVLAARQRVERFYGLDAMLDAYERVYAAAVG